MVALVNSDSTPRLPWLRKGLREILFSVLFVLKPIKTVTVTDKVFSVR